MGVPLLRNHFLDSLTTEKVGTGPRFQEGNRFIDRKLMVIVILGDCDLFNTSLSKLGENI